MGLRAGSVFVERICTPLTKENAAPHWTAISPLARHQTVSRREQRSTVLNKSKAAEPQHHSESRENQRVSIYKAPRHAVHWEPIASVGVSMAQIEIRKENSMDVRTFAKLLPVIAMLLSGAAFAQGAGGASSGGGAAGTGSTSGTAAGTNVEPSTAIQKQDTGRSSAGGSQAGAPGTEGQAGTQSGPLPDDQTNPSPK